LGRIFNVLGEVIDGEKFDKNQKGLQFEPIHKARPFLADQETKPQILETGIKVIDLMAPFTKEEKPPFLEEQESEKPLSLKN
jgi:F-type H+-transporting ATPase subunit beta